jgi:tetratricopeptide (TPR) repeat protein
MRIAKLVCFISAMAAVVGLAGAGLQAQVLTTPGKSNGSSTIGGFPRDTRILMLQGRVILDDGKAPNEPIVIERVCGTFVYKEGVANQRGEYSIQLGQNQAVFQDASTNGQTLNTNPGAGRGLTSDVSPNALWDCELRATLTGYRTESVSLSNQRNADNPVINFVLHYTGDVKGGTTSVTSEQAPKDAKKAYQKGLDAVKASNPDEAQKDLLKAVGVFPKYAAAWFELGQVYESRGHVPEAKDAYNQAIAGDPNYVNPYEKLYLLAAKESDWPQVAELTGKLLGLDPYDFAGAYYYNALANLQANKLDAAERSGREAVKVAGPKAEVRAHYVLGLILGRKGDLPGAVAELREFLTMAPSASNRAQIEQMISSAESAMAQTKAGPPKQ